MAALPPYSLYTDCIVPFANCTMAKTYMIPARYMEQNALEAFLGNLFGPGKVRVLVSAWLSLCTLNDI
jgi:hypothetical protein